MVNRKGLLAERDWVSDRRNITRAFEQFVPRAPKPTNATGRRFFIWYKEKCYPPKEIRSIVENRPTSEFSGGSETNKMFRNLGFHVARVKSYQDYERAAHLAPKNARCLTQLDGQVDELFSKSWVDFNKKTLAEMSSSPGVYLLAYTSEPLGLSPVRVDDIFYVGMSTTALKLRLLQFWNGLEDGGHHSAAKRFYEVWAQNRGFRQLKTKNQFYVATLPIDCTPTKGLRTWFDLETLGTVVALEYLALARIVRELDLEPPLNKK